MSQRLVIIDGIRTPLARAGGALSALSADDLGRRAVSALLTKTGLDPESLDEVIFGCVHQPEAAPNIARAIALRAGIPQQIPSATVQRQGASGLEALMTAHERLQAGRGSLFVVGGVESMSSLLGGSGYLSGRKAVAAKTTSGSPLGIPAAARSMGAVMETLTREQGITRDAQDDFALRSHEKAAAARDRAAEEIAPVYTSVGDGSGSLLVEADEVPQTTPILEVLRGLPLVYDRFGAVTTGNSAPAADGAVALLVGTEARAEELGLTPLGYLREYAYTGCEEARPGLGPLSALEALEARSGLSVKDADIVELDEAFAAQALATLKLLRDSDREISPARLNVHGGVIALGHPLAATGARLVLSSLLELRRRELGAALIALDAGDGQGAALWLERPR